MLDRAADFYRDYIAESTSRHSLTTTSDMMTEIHPINRLRFFVGSNFAGLMIIKSVAMSALYLIGTVFTAFQNQSAKTGLANNLQDIPVYIGSVALGLLGVLIPQTINNKFLELPATHRGLPRSLTTAITG